MRTIKIYLGVVTLLLVVALVGVMYVWGLYQGVYEDKSAVSDVRSGEVVVPLPETEPGNIPKEGSVPEEQPESLTIDASTLSDSQRAILETFGFGGDEIVVSDALIVCAKDAVGETRFLEVVNGAAPSPLEALALVPCAKK